MSVPVFSAIGLPSAERRHHNQETTPIPPRRDASRRNQVLQVILCRWVALLFESTSTLSHANLAKSCPGFFRRAGSHGSMSAKMADATNAGAHPPLLRSSRLRNASTRRVGGTGAMRTVFPGGKMPPSTAGKDARRYETANTGLRRAFGCTFGTDGPLACLKWTLERRSKVPRHKSASGKTTLKFFPIYRWCNR